MTAFRQVFLGLGLFFVGWGGGWFIGHHLPTSSKRAGPPVEVRIDSPSYKFINPLLLSRTDKNLYVDEYRDLTVPLEKYIEQTKKDGTAKAVSVYFRDMNTGHWTGINEDDTYEPGSMMKVAVLMSYVKRAETEPNILAKKLAYKGPDTSNPYYKPSATLADGYHSVKELLEAMVRYSDNVAMGTLIDYDREGFNLIYTDFRLPTPTPFTVTSDYMSARSYSSMWRSLYNATYLRWDYSEEVLALLSDTEFAEGLTKGVPEGLTVAHKFGERTFMGPQGIVASRELHDCGIIYYPESPYFLCVMTKGSDFPLLASIIQEISQKTYEFVQDHARK